VSPQDNNETDRVWAFYAEDAQTLFDRWTIRGGLRQTYGTTTLLQTPYAPTLLLSDANYQATTFSAGTTYKVTDWLTARAGASSGFRAPTATELGSNFTITPIGTTIRGNPDLSPETSQQFEIGGTVTTRNARLDLALFQNTISNRIAAQTVSSVGGVVVQQYQNNPSNVFVQGVELQAEVDVHRTLGLPVAEGTRWSVFTNSSYNFQMVDFGANVITAGTNMATRMYQYQAAIGTRWAELDARMPWNVQLLGLLRGPMWYNTEEALNPLLFPGQVRNTTVYRKDPFWVWNTRGEIEVRKGVKFYAALNNIFDINNSPIYIGLDQVPCGDNQLAQNGSCGNSMPGREFIIGTQIRF
jgi:vitamin B12 transporter